MVVRKPAVAGSFYPKDAKALKKMVDSMLEERSFERPLGIIVPHAGYVYSGKVAGKVYGLFKGSKDLKFLLIGPSHFVDFVGVSFGDYHYFETPLGLVEVDRESIDKFLDSFDFPHAKDNLPHVMEHSLEVQLPFLQRAVDDFSIIPVLYGRIEPETLLEVIYFFCNEGAYLVISSDLSHYYPDHLARQLDSYCHEGILKLNWDSLKDCQACGKVGILASVMWSKKKNLKPKLIAYATSAEAYGNKSSVVGYGGYAFFA